ncbi:MAG: hypothetical protein IPK22_28800 [Verrucomicrobiaceae bacterium]|nr:hypothetical protein [Verrucomicrobiaceae bacterium]
MPYKTPTENEKSAALSDVLPKFTENALDNQVLALTHGTNLYDAKETRIDAVDAPQPDQALAALDFIRKTMDQQMGVGTADRILSRVSLKNPNQIDVGELKAIGQAYALELDVLRQQLEDPNNAVAQKWAAAANGQAVPAAKGAAESLQELLENPDVEWKVSTSGSGGALLAVTPDKKGAVVKIEEKSAVQKASALSSALANGFSAGGGAYEVAEVADESENVAAKQLLQEKVEQLKVDNADNPAALRHLENHAKQLNNNDIGVGKMKFVSGVQLNKLPLPDKLALLQNGQLAHEIGKAAVLCPVAGLADHAAPGVTGLPTNMSNFMINEETGKIAPIDFDAKDLDNGNYGVKQAGAGVKKLAELASKACHSAADFDQVVSGMMQAFDGGTNSEVADAMGALSPNGNNEGLFSDVERKAVAPLMNEEIAKKQAVAMLSGVIDGLAYLQEHQKTIQEGLAAAGMGDPDELDEGFQAVKGMDFPEMRQEMRINSLRVDPDQIQDESVKKDVKYRKGQVEASKDRIAKAKETIAQINQDIGDLERQIAEKKGIFSGGDRKKLGEQLSVKKAELLQNERQLTQLTAKLAERENSFDQSLRQAARPPRQNMNRGELAQKRQAVVDLDPSQILEAYQNKRPPLVPPRSDFSLGKVPPPSPSFISANQDTQPSISPRVADSLKKTPPRPARMDMTQRPLPTPPGVNPPGNNNNTQASKVADGMKSPLPRRPAPKLVMKQNTPVTTVADDFQPPTRQRPNATADQQELPKVSPRGSGLFNK